jgi:adenine-specific DNA-methyltransferase
MPEMTDVEVLLWQKLRNRQLLGFKFRRQWTLGPFIVDFFCWEAGLVVELDGGQHSEEGDANRTSWLEEQGYEVRRFWNNEVMENLDGVLEAIAADLRRLTPHPNPLPRAGEGEGAGR